MSSRLVRSMSQPPADASAPVSPVNEREILLTLFDLGRKVTSVIDLDELLPRIPELVARLIPFDAFARATSSTRSATKSALGLRRRLSGGRGGFRLSSSEGIIGRVVADAAADRQSATWRPTRATSGRARDACPRWPCRSSTSRSRSAR